MVAKEIVEARLVGLDVYDHELLNTIIDYISTRKLTSEEAKKVGEIRIIAYEKAKERLKTAI